MLTSIFINKIKRYCETMLIEYEIEEDQIKIDGLSYQIVDPKNMVFDFEMNFLPELNLSESLTTERWFYYFGGRFYTHEKGDEVDLKEVKYLGKAKQSIPTKSFLGIRSGFELMNGMGLYKEWVNKAKFLGVEALAICENKTLSGVLSFQDECKRQGIKSIVGMTIPVKGEELFYVKAYVQNFQGWLTLLKHNTILNLDGELAVSKKFLEENNDGLIIVIDPKYTNYLDRPECAGFYQLETVEFSNSEKDVWFLKNLEMYMKSSMEPIAITDAFYLEKKDKVAREMLWTINKAFDDKTENQYFKSKSEYAKELFNMFEEGNKSWVNLFNRAIANESDLVDECNFTYDTDTRHLPKYIMTEEESSKFKNKEDLFIHIIQQGFKDKNIKDQAKYITRLKEEIRVLKKGDVIDYFLGLYDIIKFAKSKNMLTGIGRGSAGGSLVSYLMGITQIDPLEFDLLFERFLNDGRMGEFEDRPQYNLELEDGSIVELIEGSLVRIVRNSKELVTFVHDLQEGDDLIKY